MRRRTDEYFSQWYEIAEVITWGFGMKKKISFKGVFHDLPYGMQSHVYAPMGVDMRNKYRIGGNQPGEPREARELGVDTPLDGLYLREDVEIVCNIALASYVKKEAKDATGKMVERMLRKAELLDEGKLHAMFENGMLKTSKPNGFGPGVPSGSFDGSVTPNSVPSSPGASSVGFGSPRLDSKGFGNYHDIARTASQNRTSSILPGYHQHAYSGSSDHLRPGPEKAGHSSMPFINELEGSNYQHSSSTNFYPGAFRSQGAAFRSELPGDTSFSNGLPSPQPSPRQPSQTHLDPTSSQPQYQAYPGHLQQSSDRGSVGGYSNHSDAARTSSYGGQEGAWQNGTANDSQASASRQPSQDNVGSQQQQEQSTNNIVPDHERFAWLNINESAAPPRTPNLPPRNPLRRLSQIPSNEAAKCPVCGLFEGDEAAVSHHVSQAHFT